MYYPPNCNKPIEHFNKNRTESVINKTYDFNYNKSLILNQVQLAKKHGIYVFGIVYNYMKLNEDIFNPLAFEEDIKFPFFIILNWNWNNTFQKINYLNKNITFNNKIRKNLIDAFEKYFLSEKYIKLKGKPILGIVYSSSLITHFIRYIRKIENTKKNRIIYIVCLSFGNSKYNCSNISKTINSSVEFPNQNISLYNSLNRQYFYNFYHNNLYRKESFKPTNIEHFFIVNGCKPEKFYIIFKEYLNINKPGNLSFILFNAWNDYKKNSFLEPRKEFGYSYLNYFSKALFNKNDNVTYDLSSLNNKCKIAVQVHLFYDDLIGYIINKVNNIPVKFDLFITITSPLIYNFIQNYIKNHSKSTYFEILIVENKGRDILPFLNQIRTKYKKYKYLCHIHSKKSKLSKFNNLGNLWREYLFNNLLGNINVVSEILYELERNKELGLIFPEAYYRILNPFYIVTNGTKKWMNFLATKLFPNHKIGRLLNFPAGNMFWAKIDAIFQIFIHDFSKYFPNENDQTNDTIMHGIERIWLYLVKFNHFYYKSIFKFF